MRESNLQKKCLKWLESRKDICVANIHGGGWTAKGFPDLIACIKGHYVAFELKVGENDMQDDQKVWRNRILRAGGYHFCPRSLEEFIKDVNEVEHDQN